MKKRFLLRQGLMLVAGLFTACAYHEARAQHEAEEKKISNHLAQLAAQFFAAYMQGNIERLVSFYTDDAVIFPGNSDLLRGKEAIKRYWTLPEGRTITHHKITALEIKLLGDFAYDYGYYEVSGRNGEEAWGPNYGKYLIVWKRDAAGAWKMHLDMWNSRPKPE